MYVCVCVQLFTKKNFEMAAENIKIGSSPYNFIHELIVYIVSSPVTSKNKSSLHTFLFSWSTMSGTSVGNFVQSCATEKTRNPQNTNRSSQPHCLSIFLYFNKQFRKSMWCPFQPTGKYQKKTPCSTEKSLDFSGSDSSPWDARQQAGQHQPQRRSNRRLWWKKCRKKGKILEIPNATGRNWTCLSLFWVKVS